MGDGRIEYEEKKGYFKSYFKMVLYFFIFSIIVLLFAFLLMQHSNDTYLMESRRFWSKIGSIECLMVNIAMQVFQIKNYRYIIENQFEEDTKVKRLYLYFSIIVFGVASITEGAYLLFMYK